MGEIFITGDSHLDHWSSSERNIIKYCNRPFDSIEEHDEKIIENWNEVVGSNRDIVIINGDLALTSVQN